MSINALCDWVFDPIRKADHWRTGCQHAFEGLFDGPDDRYYKSGWESKVTSRINATPSRDAIPYAALIHPDNPNSGPYSGMSFVLFPPFPPDDENAPLQTGLIGLVIGTRGLHPDEEVLARPGHARKAQAIARHLNARVPSGEQVAWAKSDPVRTDRDIPQTARRIFEGHESVFDKYGSFVYSMFQPSRRDDRARDETRRALKAYLDLLFEHRGIQRLKAADREAQSIQNDYLGHVFETVDEGDVFERLNHRKYVILEGPPGTGKTRLANRLREAPDCYDGRGETVQFHPNTTYEDVVGGLAPAVGRGELGLDFEPTPGLLMRAADRARQVAPAPYLLHIDEINRADLGTVLGEAIYLFEHRQYRADEVQRRVELPHDFSDTIDASLLEGGFGLPENLHVLGTMNTSDRSIAHLDVAIRRRFAFLTMWPRHDAVRDVLETRPDNAESDVLRALVLGDEADDVRSANLFGRLFDIFVDFAPDDALDLMPGHSYFLADSRAELARRLRGELIPLLEQYIRQGHVAGFADELRAYMQTVESVLGPTSEKG